ncbi:DNA-binding transcriptional regulator KdgR, partial [Salmonella enterica subsp. enterica serovar Infantis]
FPTLRFSEYSILEYVAMLQVAARKISDHFGYNDYHF